jgi:hypothetical protein
VTRSLKVHFTCLVPSEEHGFRLYNDSTVRVLDVMGINQLLESSYLVIYRKTWFAPEFCYVLSSPIAVSLNSFSSLREPPCPFLKQEKYFFSARFFPFRFSCFRVIAALAVIFVCERVFPPKRCRVGMFSCVRIFPFVSLCLSSGVESDLFIFFVLSINVEKNYFFMQFLLEYTVSWKKK